MLLILIQNVIAWAVYYLLCFCWAANLNSVQPLLITYIQTLTQAINLVGDRLVLIGHKWDFSWPCATENDRLCVWGVKTICSHRRGRRRERCQTNGKGNSRKPVWIRISFPLFPLSLFSHTHTHTRKQKIRISISWSYIICLCSCLEGGALEWRNRSLSCVSYSCFYITINIENINIMLAARHKNKEQLAHKDLAISRTNWSDMLYYSCMGLLVRLGREQQWARETTDETERAKGE